MAKLLLLNGPGLDPLGTEGIAFIVIHLATPRR
jgi:hypothetical protein